MMSTSNGYSVEAYGSLARSQYFSTWADAADLVQQTPAPPEIASVFHRLATLVLPHAFTQTPPNPTVHGEVEFYESLREWGSLNAGLVDPEKGRDDLNLGADSKALFLAYRAISGAVKEELCELAQRRGVDTLIQLAFEARLSASHEVCFEQELHLRDSTLEGVECEVGTTAIADTVVTSPIPGEKMTEIVLAIHDTAPTAERQDFIRRLFWRARLENLNLNSLILFPGEFKKTEHTHNQNQLLMDFATAQSQRFAFGLPDAIIWGATCTMGRFKVYSSSWRSNHSNIYWSYLTEWNLTVPIEFLRCYSFLCSLSSNLSNISDTIRSLNPTAVAEKCSRTAWRARPPVPRVNANKRKRRSSGNNVAGPRGGEAAEGMGYLDDAEQSDSEGGSWGPSGPNGDGLEPEEAEAWNKEATRWKMEANEMYANDTSLEGHKGLVYDQVHGLACDADWWRSHIH